MNEPKVIFYKDYEQTKPIKLLDFGEIDSDENSIITVYAVNFGDVDLHKVKFLPNDKNVDVIEYPVEMPVGIPCAVKLRWHPLDGANLSSPLIIEGKYFKKM